MAGWSFLRKWRCDDRGFAHARYTTAFIQTHHGDPAIALTHLAKTEALSPFDPFLASFQITRAMALARLGQMDQAAHWARRAAAGRNAYPQMLGNAAIVLAAAGEVAEARRLVALLRQSQPGYDRATLLRTFYAPSPEMAALIRDAGSLIGL